MIDRKRAERFAIYLQPTTLEYFELKRAAWYETPAQIRAGIRWGKRKAELLQWVRREMGRRLTKRERWCIELYYFHALSYEEVGSITRTRPSSAFRAVRRAIRKLRAQAQAQGLVLKRRSGRPERGRHVGPFPWV